MNFQKNRLAAFKGKAGEVATRLFVLAGAGIALGLAGCSSSGDDSEAAISPNPIAATVFVAETGVVNQNDQEGTILAAIDPSGTDGGLAFDQAGNLVQAGSTGVIRTFCAAANIDGDPDGFFRELNTGGTPIAVAIAHEAGFYFVVHGDTNLDVFASGAPDGAAPLASLALDDDGFDLHYEEADDRLFVALGDGTVAVYDDFVGDAFGASGAARFIDPFDEGTGDSSLRGIAYDAPNDRLVVSDIGAPGGTDGRIYVIDNASIAEGEAVDDPDTTEVNETIVSPSQTITGAATLLGDPVDLFLNGVALRVADTATDRVLFFNNLYEAGLDGNIAPDSSYAAVDPVSIAVSSGKVFPSVNDIGSGAGLDMTNVAVVSNVLAGSSVNHYARDLSAPANTFDAGAVSVENLTFDLNGDGYVTFDDDTDVLGSGGIGVIHRLAKGRDGDTVDGDRDREITGAIAGLASPKGITVLGNSGLLAVSENSANGVDGAGIYVFSSCVEGNVAPVTTVATAAAPWDADYVQTFSLTVVPAAGATPALTAREPLFVALTDGTVEVYNKFTAAVASGDPIAPALTMTLPGATNLHGIHYHSGRDALIMSDVGLAGDATDGKLYVLFGVKSLIFAALHPDRLETTPTLALGRNVVTAGAPAPTNARSYTLYEVTGDASTILGNPVDIAFDGSTLYVANKTGTTAGLLRYAKFLTEVEAADPGNALDPKVPTGMAALDADTEEAVTSIESVSLVPDFLSTKP